MKVFTHTGFRGYYPVGTSAVIVARDRGHAKRLLLAALPDELKAENQDLDISLFEEVDTSKPNAVILQDGDY